MHARHGLMPEARCVECAGKVAVHANPMHLASHRDLRFADNGNVVFGLAREHAGVATDARGQINGHAPAMAVVVMFRGIKQRLVLVRRFDATLHELGVGEKLAQRAFAINLSRLGINDPVRLGCYQLITRTGFLQGDIVDAPWIVGSAQSIGVESRFFTDAANTSPAVTEMNGN